MKITKTLMVLQPDITHTFYSPLYSRLVRTGVIGDGSCFLHALFYACSKHYRHMSIPQRHTYIQKVRTYLTTLFSLDIFKEIGNGEMYRLLCMEAFRSLMTKQGISEVCIDQWLGAWNTLLLSDLESISGCSHEQIQQIKQHVYDSMCRHIEYAWIDDFLIQYFSHVMHCNFLFVMASTRVAYPFQNLQYTRTIVFCWIHESHYEILGVRDPKTKRVERQFKQTHPFIQCILKSVKNI